MEQKPKVTEHGLVWSKPEPKPEPKREARPETTTHTPDSPAEDEAHAPPESARSTAPADETGTGTTPSAAPAKRRRWGLIALGVLLAVLIVWIIANRLTAGGDSTPTIAQTTTTAGPQASEAETTAIEYRSLMLQAETDKACGMRVEQDLCLRVSGSAEPLTASQAPNVVQSAEVSRPSAAGSGDESATAVLIEFTIQDQPNAQREVVFVRSSDSKVIGTEGVGSEDAGKTLQQLFEEAS